MRCVPIAVLGWFCFAISTAAQTPTPATITPVKPPVAVEAEETTDAPTAGDASAETYLLVYKMQPGEKLQSKVTHLVTVETKIRGAEQTARTRSISTKTWTVQSVDAQGNIRFVHQVDDVDMWSAVTGRDEVKYNSQTDTKAPAGYEHVADAVGKPLATVTIAPSGRVLSRSNATKQFNPGIGELTVPLPEQRIKIGTKWHTPDEVLLRQEDGMVKKVQVRQQYRLEKIESGVATINVETQVLTPVNDPKLQSQLVQRLQKGTIKFDVDAGRLLHKQMELNEQVLGFNGADSSMQYLARFTEEPIAVTTARAPAASPTTQGK
jgi:hypothetical protein